ncbi:DUF402 domain-containing protein [Brevibacterium marinum]|uniref:DUF402 domain-containing protein n=1 Tax=Brevibacterium marinum TaxID=418643 RepID=A0A846S1E2_9MICO|nr:DUF402 domain-containing protein [Brevibacterium marinum]NJC55981.1 hypothetical protein [Brevibacterium marinum]
MEFTDPYEIDIPAGTRHVGEGPFWTPGETVIWSFRRFDFDRDHAEVRRPMRVIEDSPSGAVLWMAGGTATTDTRIVGWEGSDPHDVPLQERFRPLAEAPRRINAPGTWRGLGVLKIVPARVPFSVWVLLKPGVSGNVSSAAGAARGMSDDAVRADWYVNLEATHRRTDGVLYTSDHILDITFPVDTEPLHAPSAHVVSEPTSSGHTTSAYTTSGDAPLNPNGAVFKDVDELAAAANFGAWPREWSDIIRSNGSQLLDNLGEFTWAFDPRWEVRARELVAESAASDSSRNQEHRPIRAGCYSKDRI